MIKRLREQFSGDLRSLQILTSIVSWWWPHVQLDWIVKAFKENIMHELDFNREANNSEHTKALFQMINRKDVYIPNIRWDATSSQVSFLFLLFCLVIK